MTRGGYWRYGDTKLRGKSDESTAPLVQYLSLRGGGSSLDKVESTGSVGAITTAIHLRSR